MIFAFDLDGTFLGGSEESRQKLYELISDRDDIRLVLSTGRGLESVMPLLSDPTFPEADYIISDVGATVVHGDSLEPVQPLQSIIARQWPGTLDVVDALSHLDYLERQEVPQERRCSFFADFDDIGDELAEIVDELGCQLLYSANKYVDVLPPGVNKGSTLRQLVKHEGGSLEDVVVAGDTLNDLSMYEEGFKGVVVGNAEPKLKAQVGDYDDVYIADGHGAAGILEALEQFDTLSRIQGPVEVERSSDPGDAQLVMVYHRLPFEEHETEDGEIVRKPPSSPNGIIPTLLDFFRSGYRGSWVAWSYRDSREPDEFEPEVQLDDPSLQDLTCNRIALTEDDVDLFYKTFSKEALWPVVFSFPSYASFDQEHWEHYVEINRLFAKRTAETAEHGATVWVHDYNLWLVPGMLRRMRPDLEISFFHHTAFPPPDIFNILPWRREIVSSLLQCDYVGFHIPHYVENFVGVVRSHASVDVLDHKPCAPRFLTYGCAMGVDEMVSKLEVGGRELRLGAHPVGINVDHIEEILQRPDIQDQINEMKQEFQDRTAILSVERLDYVKGPLEKLRAFEQLLENHPEYREDVVLMTIHTPPSKGMSAYDEIRDEVERAVGRINGRFGTLDWTPVRYFFRAFPFEEVIGMYAASDIAWITPLRDGLNLVAKEFVATQGLTDSNGVLVLSEFAGAAVELHGALLTNPYHSASMEDGLHRALSLNEEERKVRINRMFDIVSTNDVDQWGERFLNASTSGQSDDRQCIDVDGTDDSAEQQVDGEAQRQPVSSGKTP